MGLLYLLPLSKILPEELRCLVLVEKIRAFYEPAGSLLNSKLPPSLPILSQINKVHASPCHFLKNSYVSLDLQSGQFPSGVANKAMYTGLIPTQMTDAPPNSFSLI
jgi:hypothetical protein